MKGNPVYPCRVIKKRRLMPVGSQCSGHIPPDTGAWSAVWCGYEVTGLTYRADHGCTWEQSTRNGRPRPVRDRGHNHDQAVDVGMRGYSASMGPRPLLGLGYKRIPSPSCVRDDFFPLAYFFFLECFTIAESIHLKEHLCILDIPIYRDR